jgi:hypothetical protein
MDCIAPSLPSFLPPSFKPAGEGEEEEEAIQPQHEQVLHDGGQGNQNQMRDTLL